MKKENEVKQAVQQQFGKNAEQYVQSQTHAKGDDLALLVKWIQPQKDWTVLDVATGGGHVARTLSPYAGSVVATDLTRPMLEAASRANRRVGADNIFYVQADAESLPFLDEAFDVITCRIAAHHFPDPAVFVREVGRVLRTGGLLLLIDNIVPDIPEIAGFVNQIEQMRDTSHVRCLSIREWEALFAACSLDIRRRRQRKKQFAFPQWVQRTSESTEQEEAVERCLLGASDEIKAYLNLGIENGRVETHQIDEWMVLCEKKGGIEFDESKA